MLLTACCLPVSCSTSPCHPELTSLLCILQETAASKGPSFTTSFRGCAHRRRSVNAENEGPACHSKNDHRRLLTNQSGKEPYTRRIPAPLLQLNEEMEPRQSFLSLHMSVSSAQLSNSWASNLNHQPEVSALLESEDVEKSLLRCKGGVSTSRKLKDPSG